MGGKKRLAHARWIDDKTLHIETELGIVNIVVGLHDTEGHKVESVEINPDQYAGEPKCHVDGKDYLRVRIIQEKTESD